MNLVNAKYDPLQLAFNLISSIQKNYKKDFNWSKWSNVYSIDYLWGNPKFREAIDSKN